MQIQWNRRFYDRHCYECKYRTKVCWREPLYQIIMGAATWSNNSVYTRYKDDLLYLRPVHKDLEYRPIVFIVFMSRVKLGPLFESLVRKKIATSKSYNFTCKTSNLDFIMHHTSLKSPVQTHSEFSYVYVRKFPKCSFTDFLETSIF